MAKVTVVQQEGEIVLTEAGDTRVYSVKNGKASVPDEELARFLAAVPGASVASATADKPTGDTT